MTPASPTPRGEAPAAPQASTAPVVHGRTDAGAPGFHQERATGIGSSDIAAILGLSRYGSAWSVWAEKTGLIPPDEGPEADHLWFGKVMEPVLAQLFTRRTGLEVVGEQTYIRDVDAPWRRATVDGFVVHPGESDWIGTVEFKTDRRSAWADGIPVNYRAQAIWQAGISRLHRAWVGVIFSRFNFDVYELTWTPDVETDWLLMCAEADRFWTEHVITGIPPEVDGSEATADAIAQVWPQHQPGNVLDATAELVELLRSRAAIKARMRADEAVIKQLDNELAVALADAELIAVDGRPAWSYKTQERTTVDRKALEAAHPGLAAPFTKTSAYRVLREIKEPKK